MKLQWNDKLRALVLLHIAVILFGFTAILGDLINISAALIVWWRVLITCISLLFFLRFGKDLRGIPKRLWKAFALIGVLIGIHWLCFYGAVKLSNASITLVCMATTSLFTSIIEPIYFRRKVQGLEMVLGALMIPCMYLVVNGIEEGAYLGVFVGLLSAFFAAAFTVGNKKIIDDVKPMVMSFIELGAVFVLISLLIPPLMIYNPDLVIMPPSAMDWIYLLILSLACTTLAWVISLVALKHISAFENNLIVNLEPVYGILLAAVILKEHEQLNPSFYIGAGLILVVVLLYPISKKINQKTNARRQKTI